MKSFLSIVLIAILFLGCQPSKNLKTTAVAIVPLPNYIIHSNVALPADVNHFIFTKADDFNRHFFMTKSSPKTVKAPDFTSQSVVGVVLKPTTKVISVDINKAEIGGENLNIY